jgi:hypothetical protein
MGVREPVWGRRELVSHHGATGGGVRGPKMRHLVLYKLAGFFPTDWQPIGRELCPQKRCQKCAISCTNRSKMPTFRPGNALFVHFLQGGGATFWQAKNGGFWGLARSARDTSRARKNGVPSPFPSTDFFISQKIFIFACATKTFRLVALLSCETYINGELGTLRVHPE